MAMQLKITFNIIYGLTYMLVSRKWVGSCTVQLLKMCGSYSSDAMSVTD